MGFLNAVKELGRMEAEMLAKKREGLLENDPFEDIANFLSLPMPLDSKEKGQIIRVWLKVRNVEGALADENAILDVEGIDRIDRIEYGAGGDAPNAEALKKKLLYRKPVGSNVNWRFAPVHILWKGKKEASAARKAFVGENDWETNTKTNFYKLREQVLNEYERTGIWKKGAIKAIFDALTGKFLNQLTELWCLPKVSYVLVFGLAQSGLFIWPGEVPQYRGHFRMKLNSVPTTHHKKSSCRIPLSKWVCSECMAEMDEIETHNNLDKVFTFATFDKPGFLPGLPVSEKEDAASRRRVWPLCRSCFGLMSRGRSYIDRVYVRGDIIVGMNAFVIPELLFSGDKLQQLDERSRDFIKNGIRIEKKLFSLLAYQGDGLVFHFVFWEKKKSQELIHLMVEDVPPTRLKKLATLWSKAIMAYPFSVRAGMDENEKNNLDYAIRAVVSLFLSQGAKGEEEKKWLRDKALNVLGRLLGGETIDIMGIKALAVSRFPGNFADPEWVKYAGIHTLDMARVVDFLIRSNER